MDALIREVVEETGQIIHKATFVAAFYSVEHYSIALCFHVILDSLQEITFDRNELSDVDLFRFDQLPKPMSPRYEYWINHFYQTKGSTPNNLIEFG